MYSIYSFLYMGHRLRDEVLYLFFSHRSHYLKHKFIPNSEASRSRGQGVFFRMLCHPRKGMSATTEHVVEICSDYSPDSAESLIPRTMGERTTCHTSLGENLLRQSSRINPGDNDSFSHDLPFPG